MTDSNDNNSKHGIWKSADSQQLRLPTNLKDPGLLVGWSLERIHARQPIGFSFGNPLQSPDQGYLDPILFNDEGHLITIAPTGAGKGVGCIVPALLRHKGPAIIIDPKGENYAITARHRREMGQQVHVLDIMGITDAPESDRATLNPLDAIDPEHATSVDEMSAIVTGLASRFKASKDHFWAGRASQLILGLMAHVVADLPKEERHFGTVRKLVMMSVNETANLVKRLENSRHPLAYELPALLGLGAKETVGGIQSFAQEMVDFVHGPLVEKAIAKTSFDLEAVMRGDPMTIYIVLPPHMLVSHGQLLRLWISALLSAIVRRQARPKEPTLFILDEAAQLGHLPQLQQAITLLRGYGLKTWSFWQDVSQIAYNYPDNWETMINNCRVIQCFGANNMNAARTMSSLVGFGTAEAVLDLEDHEMLLQIAGDEAVFAQLPNYLSNPTFKGQFDDNPYYENSSSITTRQQKSIRWYLRPKKPWVDPWINSPVTPEFKPDLKIKELIERIVKQNKIDKKKQG